MFAKHFHTGKWAQLGNQTLLFPKPWHNYVRHVYGIEPLSVGAFVNAITRHLRKHITGWVLDIGVNLGWYTVLASMIAPNLRVLGVDMQPKCAEITKCGLQLNSRKATAQGGIQVLTKYVSSVDTPPIQVPEGACDTMASPSAVAGRRPDGRLRGTMRRLNQTKTIAVGPILLGPYLIAHAARGERVAVTKIDTEGYETRILESLRSTWGMLDDIVLELQPRAWVHHGITLESGIKTLRDILSQNRYLVVSLPHPRNAKTGFQTVTPKLVDPCTLRRHGEGSAKATGEARLYSMQQLEAFIRETRGFSEFLFTRQTEGSPLCAAESKKHSTHEATRLHGVAF